MACASSGNDGFVVAKAVAATAAVFAAAFVVAVVVVLLVVAPVATQLEFLSGLIAMSPFV